MLALILHSLIASLLGGQLEFLTAKNFCDVLVAMRREASVKSMRVKWNETGKRTIYPKSA